MAYTFSEDIRFWDGIAQRYAARPVDDPDAFERKIAIMRGLLTPDSRVLDVGCGTGSLALVLAADAGEVHGLDISEAMVGIARGKAEQQGADNVHFHVGDLGTAQAFDKGSLDLVCACSLLHLVPDRLATLRHIHALLRPGGHLAVSSLCLGNSWVPYGAVITAMRWVGKAPHVLVYDEADLRREVADAGFVDVELHDVGAKDRVVAFLTARKPG